jgi:DnaA family protein
MRDAGARLPLMRQIPLAIGPEPARAFDNFLDAGNAGVVAHLRALAPGSPPVYLWGPIGSGKTHLLQAVTERARESGWTVARFDAAAASPWEVDGHASFVLFDDCEQLDAERQHEAFAAFLAAGDCQATVVAAGDRPPVDLPVREDLRTRLGWGHVFALQPLGEAETRAALRREADRRGTFLSDDVMDFLLSRFARDLSHLMGLLDRLDAYSLETRRAITVPLLKQMLAEP